MSRRVHRCVFSSKNLTHVINLPLLICCNNFIYPLQFKINHACYISTGHLALLIFILNVLRAGHFAQLMTL